MIVSSIRGGLGNQLFMYAFGRSLSLQRADHFVCDQTTAYKYDRFGRRPQLNDVIKSLESRPFPLLMQCLHLLYKTRWPRGWMRFGRNALIMQRGKPNDFSDDHTRHLCDPSIKNIWIFGYWQNEKYFVANRDRIKREIELSSGPSERNIAEAIGMREKHAVCIHARQSYELKSSNRRPRGPAYGLRADYYRRAIDAICRDVTHPVFYGFTDRPNWFRDHLPDVPILEVSWNSGPNRSIYDLWLMQHCNHFILANSTFSWWAPWLSSARKKIVIAPDNAKIFGGAAPCDGWRVI